MSGKGLSAIIRALFNEYVSKDVRLENWKLKVLPPRLLKYVAKDGVYSLYGYEELSKKPDFVTPLKPS